MLLTKNANNLMVFVLALSTIRGATSLNIRSASTNSLKTLLRAKTSLLKRGGTPFYVAPTSTSLKLHASSTSYLSTLTSQGVTETMAESRETAQKNTFEMNDDDKYIFDLNGYIIIRGVLNPEQISAANEAIAARESDMIERVEPALRNAVKDTGFDGTGPGRKDLGQVFEWGPDSIVFKSILAHPRLIPYFHGLLGKGYRMDHLPFVIAQDIGSEGFKLHGGTIDCESGAYNPHIAYSCHQNTIRSSLLGCSLVLSDHNAGSGGFCVVPGSHKSNFKMPKGMVNGDRYRECVVQPVTKAGDVVLFSEGTVHGAMPWTQDSQRRICLYRFSPATQVYGRSYFSGEGCTWPEKMYENLSPAEKAVLEPPYANRLDRQEIQADGSVKMCSRNKKKTDHDRKMFGTQYF